MADADAEAGGAEWTGPRILMCPPRHYCIAYEINPWMDVRRGSDPAEAIRQWEGLRAKVEELGARVELIEPAEGLPDLVFTANAGLVHRDRFIPSRFRHPQRRGEEPLFEAWFAARGFRVERLPEGACFEGAGDALFVGDTLFGGYRFRSDARVLLEIGERLGARTLPLELVDPRFYHLDTCFCPLAPDAAVFHPGAFDEYGVKVIRGEIPRLIEVSGDEAASFSCNAAVVGRDVVLHEGAPRLARALEAAGYRAHPLPLTEFIKSGGSAKCLTFRIDGEEAAGWKTAPAPAPAPTPGPGPGPARGGGT